MRSIADNCKEKPVTIPSLAQAKGAVLGSALGYMVSLSARVKEHSMNRLMEHVYRESMERSETQRAYCDDYLLHIGFTPSATLATIVTP